ncbi:MAG: hypothetical protein U1F47_00620 [Hyphomicrobiales bacterium]
MPVIRFVVDMADVAPQGSLPDFHKEIAFLRQPGALERQMVLIDRGDRRQPLGRICVMGCGRSGTWLLTAVLSSFAGFDFGPEEVPLEYFGPVTTDRPVLVLRRDAMAHQRVEQIPDDIQIVFIVRHPFDVLTSHNPALLSYLRKIRPRLGRLLGWVAETYGYDISLEAP